MLKQSNKLKNNKNNNDNRDLKATTKGWPPARRKAQAERLHRSRIWQKSTGPKTKKGKKIVSQNAFKHGMRSREAFEFIKVMRQQRAFLKLLEISLQKRRLKPRISADKSLNNKGTQIKRKPADYIY